MAANGLKFNILMSSTRFWTKTKFSVPNIALQQLTIYDLFQPKTKIKFKRGFSYNLPGIFDRELAKSGPRNYFSGIIITEL